MYRWLRFAKGVLTQSLNCVLLAGNQARRPATPFAFRLA